MIFWYYSLSFAGFTKMQQNNLTENIGGFRQLDAIKANDEDALRRLYKDNYFKIEKYVLNNNGTVEDAKDIFQEAFIAVWRNIQMDKFSPESESALEGYLYRIAKNKWLDHLRSGHYKKTTAMNDAADNIGEEILPDEDVAYINAVKENFRLLGENCRQVLSRYYYQKETMKMIAAKFEWTEATAKNNKYRCLQRLRELVKNKINP